MSAEEVEQVAKEAQKVAEVSEEADLEELAAFDINAFFLERGISPFGEQEDGQDEQDNSILLI